MKAEIIINEKCIQMNLKPEHLFEKDLIDSIDRGQYYKSIITQSEGLIELRFNKNEQKQKPQYKSYFESRPLYIIIDLIIAICALFVGFLLIKVLL